MHYVFSYLSFVFVPLRSCSASGLYGIAGASLVGCDAPMLMSTLGSSGVGPAVKLAVSFPLVYHYLGAVRHTVSGRDDSDCVRPGVSITMHRPDVIVKFCAFNAAAWNNMASKNTTTQILLRKCVPRGSPGRNLSRWEAIATSY